MCRIKSSRELETIPFFRYAYTLLSYVYVPVFALKIAFIFPSPMICAPLRRQHFLYSHSLARKWSELSSMWPSHSPSPPDTEYAP